MLPKNLCLVQEHLIKRCCTAKKINDKYVSFSIVKYVR